MNFTQELIDRRVDDFLVACKKHKVKVTPQRTAIFRALAATDEHPGVEEIYMRIKKDLPNISRDTVYRTLAMFEDIGVAIKVEQLCERVRYDADTTEHQHFLCENCGAIKDFYFSGVRDFFDEKILQEIGQVNSVVLRLRGICKECLKKKDEN